MKRDSYCAFLSRVVHIYVAPRESYDLHVTAMRDTGWGACHSRRACFRCFVIPQDFHQMETHHANKYRPVASATRPC